MKYAIMNATVMVMLLVTKKQECAAVDLALKAGEAAIANKVWRSF